MADETADISNTEQLVIRMRWVDKALEVHEEFVAMKAVSVPDANSIASEIEGVISDMQLLIENIRGQCYDGASVMSGNKAGVARKFKDKNPLALYTHGYGHALNLAVKEACDNVEILKMTFETAKEIVKLAKDSPKSETHLRESKIESETVSIGILTFCPTRWTVRGKTLDSIEQNREELKELWIWILEGSNDATRKAGLRGVQVSISSFDYYFGAKLGIKILSHTDN